MDSENKKLKAKIQLSSLTDYLNFIHLLDSFTRPTRIFLQQEFVLDGPNHDLWNAGLTLSVRHSMEYYPLRESNSTSTIVMKETIFQDIIGVNGEILHFDGQTAPVYEVKETEETISNDIAKHILQMRPIDFPATQSEALKSIGQKYFVPGGIYCIGNFVNLRSSYNWQGLELEVDRCKFPRKEGYFVRFLPEESIVMKMLSILNDNGINYVIDLTSKTALFFHGSRPSTIQTVHLGPNEWSLRMPNGLLVSVTPETFYDPFSSAAPALGSTALSQPSALPTTLLTPHLTHAPMFTVPNAAMLSVIQVPAPAGASAVRGGLQLIPKSPSVPSILIPSAASSSIHLQLPGSGVSSAAALSPRSDSMSPNLSSRSGESSLGHLAGQGDHMTARPRRGRKSLYNKILEKATTGGKISTEDVPPEIAEALTELDVDIQSVDATAVPEVIKQYQRKRNSEASARYRKKKTSEMDDLKHKLEDTEKELDHFKRRCQELEKKLVDVTSVQASASSLGPADQ